MSNLTATAILIITFSLYVLLGLSEEIKEIEVSHTVTASKAF